MLERIDKDNTCHIKTANGTKLRPASELVIITDPDKAMSAVEVNGDLVHLTEAEVDALTVAGATDKRKHLKATDSGSVI
ncbi:Protein of unknown function [Pseudomonas sp. NFACC23-1]|uniref:DUF3203 family protein n=1 Tax=unclassified Pseudomonas TaxID=196821 RepID=UPI00088CF3A4|nr:MULTISPECIES: DUF3203 family protein [unclassified Pseudomonas]SDB65174.1 Protein of unknown function [Pseudomonas sp. NFACC17-2]SEJ94554.1 Protein of unknown function [Pseudomonas sp. NFACC23-1]SFW92820.1 Protein of unknown function [Pseudomonas sp. NFACC16-2]